jgi:hypothetical protein
MRHPIIAACILACLVLLSGLTRPALSPVGEARGAETQVASLEAQEASRQIVDTGRSSMPARTQTAQARCPGGQIVFLTRECGCNGACCNCSANVRYLNHCTCQCSPNPPPPGSCMKGFSVGRN